MTWDVFWTRSAATDMRRLDRAVAARVHEAVLHLAETGQGDVRKLAGPIDQWRLRVGDWRVRFVFDYQSTTIQVVRVLPRSRAYRD